MGVDQSIQADKRNLVKRSFEVFKSKGTDVVKAEDFSQVLTHEGYNVNSNAIKLLFCLLDKNKNGELSLQELQRFFKLLIEKYDFNIYKTMFEIMDTNKNQLLERNEIIRAFKVANIPLDESKVQDHYDQQQFNAILFNSLNK